MAGSSSQVCLDFASGKRTPEDIKRLAPRRGFFTRAHAQGIIRYYERQNRLIDSLLEVDLLNRGGEPAGPASEVDAKARRALNLSFATNVFLLFLRITVAVLSGSLAIIVSSLDAVLDVVSSCIMWFTAWAAKRSNKYTYPVGKARMEPLGIIVFSVIMASAAFSVIIEGIRQLAGGTGGSMGHFWFVVGGTLLQVFIKLLLFLYCRGNANPAVQAFAMDHRNDVIVNSTGLAGAVLGTEVAYWIDPVIAIILAMWVVWTWGGQARGHILNLVGVSAPPEFLQKLTYLSYTHPRVTKVDTVRAYTFGNELLVEVDIVLPEEMPLRQAHDIGEALQNKLEQLPQVARAFVHLDFETSHAPEHKRA